MPAKRTTPSARRETPLAIPDDALHEILSRLRRVEGQVRAIQEMIAQRRDCHAIAQQMSAARSAFERAMLQLMIQSMAHCLTPNGEGERELERLTETFVKFFR
jgi:DNA-binding FrmR family transcriptional regulator